MDEPETREAAAEPPEPKLAHPESTEPAAALGFADGYRRIAPRLVGFLRYQGVPLADAADIVQETMTLAYPQWDRITHHAAWARRVASRLWARRLAQTGFAATTELSESNPLLQDHSDIAAWEERHDILAILDSLPSRQRQVLAWTLEGHSPTEIAAELKMTPEAVRSSLRLARRAVAARLTRGASDD